VLLTGFRDLDIPVARQSLTRKLGIKGYLVVAVVGCAVVLLGSPEAPPVAAMAVFNLKTLREQTVVGAPALPNREQVAVVGLGINVVPFAPVAVVAVVAVARAVRAILAVRETPAAQAIPARRQTPQRLTVLA
tara:strand:- start:555 stop:953 length:399 start_codon:yes stop_codon:yes gene_type:complete